jgi:type IV secretory pathway VirJ component
VSPTRSVGALVLALGAFLGAPAWASFEQLPLIEVPASGSPTMPMAVMLTGDGGYGVTDKGIARGLAENGIPTVVLNSLHYFGKRRTPETAASDLEQILRHYTSLWNKTRVVLVGYSLGADVLPFMLNRLPPDLRARVSVLALLGLSAEADFKFHLTDWLGTHHRETDLPVVPELEKLRGFRILCFYGDEDRDTVCDRLDPGLVSSFPIESGHRFGSKYGPVVEKILNAARAATPPPSSAP